MTSSYLNLDSSVDDFLSNDNDNGFSWSSAWEALSTNAASIFDSSMTTATDVANYLIGEELTSPLTEASNSSNQVDNTGSTIDSNASTTTGAATAGGFNIDSKTLLIGGGILIGAVVLIKVL